MSERHEVERVSLAAPGGDDFALAGEDELHQEEDESMEDADEEEENPEYADEEEEDPEYYLYRIERLLQLDQRNEQPRLNPDFVFGKARIDWSAIHVNEEEFSSRLKRFLRAEDPDMPALSPELVESLFRKAIDAHRRIAAWDLIVQN